MLKSFNLKALPVLKGFANDPRVVTRAIIGVLLVANLVAAVAAFKPFGGSVEERRRQEESLSGQLAQMRTHLAQSKKLVDKVQVARTDGDSFLTKYFMPERVTSAMMLDELTKSVEASGVKLGPTSLSYTEIEGSDSLRMLSMQVGLEGTYANLTKFVNLVDKSPRFLIIEHMTATAPQQQQQQQAQRSESQTLNVSFKLDAFVQDAPGTI